MWLWQIKMSWKVIDVALTLELSTSEISRKALAMLTGWNYLATCWILLVYTFLYLQDVPKKLPTELWWKTRFLGLNKVSRHTLTKGLNPLAIFSTLLTPCSRWGSRRPKRMWKRREWRSLRSSWWKKSRSFWGSPTLLNRFLTESTQNQSHPCSFKSENTKFTKNFTSVFGTWPWVDHWGTGPRCGQVLKPR